MKYDISHKILILLNPFVPHITKSLWEEINPGEIIESQKGPEVDKNALKKKTKNMIA